MRTYRFKSLSMKSAVSADAEKRRSDLAPEATPRAGTMSYDMDSVRDHVMELSWTRFVMCRSWVSSFFLALLAVLLGFALIYGIMVIFMKVDMASSGGGLVGRLFILSALFSLLVLWAAIGIPAALKSLKWDTVVRERGNGGWRIVDEDKWERFSRILRITQEKEAER